MGSLACWWRGCPGPATPTLALCKCIRGLLKYFHPHLHSRYPLRYLRGAVRPSRAGAGCCMRKCSGWVGMCNARCWARQISCPLLPHNNQNTKYSGIILVHTPDVRSLFINAGSLHVDADQWEPRLTFGPMGGEDDREPGCASPRGVSGGDYRAVKLVTRYMVMVCCKQCGEPSVNPRQPATSHHQPATNWSACPPQLTGSFIQSWNHSPPQLW